jgi:hypothetical protein
MPAGEILTSLSGMPAGIKLNFFVRHASGRNLTSGRNLKTTKISPAGRNDNSNANYAQLKRKLCPTQTQIMPMH